MKKPIASKVDTNIIDLLKKKAEKDRMTLSKYVAKMLTEIAKDRIKPETDYQRVLRTGYMLECPLLITSIHHCSNMNCTLGFNYYCKARVDMSVCETCPKTDRDGNECESWHWWLVEKRCDSYEEARKEREKPPSKRKKKRS